MAKYVYNPETLLYEAVDESKALKIIRIILLLAGAAALVYLYFWLWTSVFGLELPKTTILRKNNAAWQARTEVVQRRLDLYEHTLEGIEDRDDDVYRSIYGLKEIPYSIKFNGTPDAELYALMDEGGASGDLRSVMRRLDTLSRRAYVQSKSLDELNMVSKQAGDMISCVPAVPPILPEKGSYHLSSPFGYRVDPVFGGGERHTGQDFACDRGYPVYATGDGIVEKSEFKFTGYGNEIVINHGYGYKTRYAHLNTIEVNQGMKVLRGEKIGSVGSSGKSTGPHLHYEVEYRGERVDPMRYMDITMPVDEYMSMIRQRRDESPRDKRSTTSELLKNRNHDGAEL